MAVTVRKKTLKLKKVGDAAPADAAAEDAPAPDSAPGSNVVLPQGMAAAGQGSAHPGDTWAAILAIIGTLLLCGLLAIQFIENSGYRSVIPIN